MDVADVLRCAADAVDRSGVSADLRAVAFTTAVELVLRTAGEAPLQRREHPAADPGADRTADRLAERPTDRPTDRLPERGPAPALRLHGADLRYAGPREHPAYGENSYDDDAPGERTWELDHRADHRTDHRADHRGEQRGEWPDAPRVLRPLSSAATQRAGVPRLAPRTGADGDGGDWSAPRRGPERLVAVGPRSWQPTSAGAGEEPWGSIADALGVRPELLDRVWEERGGKLQLAGDPARLGRTRAQRVGTAAVLLLAALRWSGRDGGEPVPDAVVRAEVERLGLLDTGNYTKHLAGRRHLLSTTGSGRTATYKLRYDGLEEARGIARALLEEV